MDSHESRPPHRTRTADEYKYRFILAGTLGVMADADVINTLAHYKTRETSILILYAAVGAVATAWCGRDYAKFHQARDDTKPK